MKKITFALMLLCIVASFTDTTHASDRHYTDPLDYCYRCHEYHNWDRSCRCYYCYGCHNPDRYYYCSHEHHRSKAQEAQETLNKIKLLEQRKAETDIARRQISRVKVLNARFYKQYTTDTLPISTAEITIENKSDYPIRSIFFNGKLVTHKTGQVLVSDTFRYDIDGAFASGETNTYDIPLNSYGEWAKIRPPDLAKFDVVVVSIEMSNGTVFVDSFSDKDRKKLDDLKNKYIY